MMDVNLLFQWLLAVSLTLLLVQLLVQKKQLIHLLFAVFCGSIAMLAAKKLSAGSIGPYHYLIGLGACATCNGYWLVSRALFRRQAPVGLGHLAFAASVALLMFSSEGLHFTQALYAMPPHLLAPVQGALGELLKVLSSCMLVLTVWEGARGYGKAGREERVQRALFLLSFGGALISCIVLGKSSEAARQNLHPWIMAVSAIQVLVVTQFLVLWRFHRAAVLCWLPWGLARSSDQQRSEPLLPLVAAVATNASVEQEVSAADAAVAADIRCALYQDRLFLQPNLKVADLARRMDLPEYRVSRVLRQGFQARNFNQFINTLRIEYAAQLLADPAHLHWPVLTVGLESGFGSAGPFTRAFKAIHGCTPNEFRSRALAE